MPPPVQTDVQTDRQPDAQPVPPSDTQRNISIDAVEIANPVVVSGRARTFENSVSLRIRDAAGRVIAEKATVAVGEMGRHNPYRDALWIARDPGREITVEALEYSARDGSEQSLVSVTKPFGVERIDAALFFANDDCTAVAQYTRRMPKSISAARLLVDALIARPTPQEHTAGARGAFPRGSAVASVNLRDGVLTVDFNEVLQNVGGSCRTQMIRDSVTRTLLRLPNVRRVVIAAGGSEELALQP
ncbi:MAG TPA: Gmad2 immunoglobulin-like domain-containing protein [Thermoanaerobaculia bacterium]|nr:Gmad2 immunoglobulin-like domain-containing protein [Thermoanaerobaculia bacterium]